MENKPNPQDGVKAKTRRSWYTIRVVMIIVVVVIAILVYFGYTKYGEGLSSKIFTQYGSLPIDSSLQEKDSLRRQLDQGMTIDSFSASLDSSLANVEADIDKTSKTLADTSPQNLSTPSIFKVNTSYQKLEAKSPSQIKAANAPTTKTDLFEVLLLSDNINAEVGSAMRSYFLEDIVTVKSVLKLLAITGKHILSDITTADDQDLLAALSESENVLGILIADRNGTVVYATNRKQIGSTVQQILPTYEIDSSTLSWFEDGIQNIAAIPLYHTFGKIGTAILFTKKRSD